MPQIKLDDVSHTFESTGGAALEVLRSISLAVNEGEFAAIVGPSGCGKTTVLRLAAGLLVPTAGRVTVAGQPPVKVRDQGQLSFMFQSATLLPWRTVGQNISLPLELAGARDDRLVESLIRLVKLDGFANHFPRELSGGMKSRVALARSIARSPSLLFLDEPFGGLDEETSRDLNLALRAVWRERQTTILLVTHNIEHAVFVAERVFVMSHRPASVMAEIRIELPEPRSRHTRFSEEYFAALKRVRHVLEGRHA
jgi:NitT/TauT family transport system ATP-binding protein